MYNALFAEYVSTAHQLFILLRRSTSSVRIVDKNLSINQDNFRAKLLFVLFLSQLDFSEGLDSANR